MSKTPTVEYLDLFPKSTALTKAEPKKNGKIQMATDVIEGELVEKNEGMTLHKSILDLLNGGTNPDGTKTVERLAFEVNPDLNAQTAGVYHVKPRLLPDEIIKRLLIQDDLIAAIVRVREHQVSSFGRPRPDRFDTGFVLELHADLKDSLTTEERAELDKRIHAAVKLFETCGHTDGLRLVDRMSFSQWLHMSTRHAVGMGRIATEVVGSGKPDSETGDKKFHHFRPLDVSTIYRATNQTSAQESVRKNALQQLKKILPPGAQIDEKNFAKGRYSWIQVIGGMARQAFTDTECLVHNFFPVADIELDHYPVTPIDTMITAITTHLNITKHNAMYFQTGRATRGMLVFESDDVDPQTLNTIKQQFNNSINGVSNSWRMPVFSVGTNDSLTWTPIDNSSRDAEFQYLNDQNARIIFSAFQISPDEVPGWSYLSRGTNNQGLSESNTEYKLEAARDVGIRPLLQNFEDFINASIFPLIDPILATKCRFRLKGLDAETEEKESVRLQQDAPLHLTIDQVLEAVEKKPIGKRYAGEFLLNPQWQSIVDKYLMVGDIMEHFLGREGASKDPRFQYMRDPFWFQNVQLQQQQAQLDQQAQMQQQQAASGQAPGGAPPQGGSDSTPPADVSGGDQSQPPAQGQGSDLSRSVDQAIEVLTKGESDLPMSKQKLLAQHRLTLSRFRRGLEDDIKEATKEILDIAEKHSKK